MTGSTSPRRVRVAGIALLAAVFVAGALAGAAMDGALAARGAPAEERAERRDGDSRASTEDFLAGLELSEEQRTRIDTILHQRRSQIDSVWSDLRPRLRAVADSARSEIAAVLAPGQRAEYERFLEEQRARRRKHDGRPGGREGR